MAYPWIYPNLLQINAVVDTGQTETPFWLNQGEPWYYGDLWASCPFLLTQAYTNDIVDISGFLRMQLNDLKYIFLSIDRKYIDKNFDHNVFIFGYDDEKDTFMISDFFDEFYQIKEVGAASIVKGYEEREELIVPMTISEFAENLDYLTFQCSWKWVRGIVDQYVNSVEDYLSGYKYRSCEVYRGMKFYGVLEKYMENSIINGLPLDLRFLKVFDEHKKMWCSFWNYCSEEGIKINEEILTAANEVRRLSKIILSYVIKYNVFQLEKRQGLMISLLRNVKSIENKYMSCIL